MRGVTEKSMDIRLDEKRVQTFEDKYDNHARYAFVTPQNKWSEDQAKRVDELFGFFPPLYSGLQLVEDFRAIFNLQITPKGATEKLKEWCQKAKEEGGKAFKTVVRTVLNNMESITNYFIRRATNAFAEACNVKIKQFRTQLRGVKDSIFFIFRLTKLLA